MKLYLQFVLRYLYPNSSSNFSSNASILAIIGLSIGLFSLILTMSIIKGFERTLEQKLSSIDGLIRVQNIFGKPISEKENLDSLLYSSGLLIDVKPYIRGTAMIHKGKQTQGVIIEGVETVPNQSFFIMDQQAIYENDIILGESLSHILDVSIEDNVIVTPLINTPKELIKKKYNIIKVSGLFKSGMQEYDKTISFVSIDKAKKIFEMDDYVTGYIVNSNEKIENIIEGLNDFVRYPYYLESWKDRHRVIFEWINIQRLPIIIIFGLIALVAITNIMATISMIIREKNSQIGILMAQGMKTSDIRKIFLFQGCIIGLLGCSLGSVSAYLFITLQNRYKLISLPEDIYFMDYVPAVFDYSIFFLILISTLLISIISTIIPTNSIVKIQPSNLLAQD
jgi:lipoprotein-releasing system permease protein